MFRITYMRQVIDEKGWCQDPAWSSSIKEMSALANLTKLQAFLEFVNYYHVYTPNMHELTALLNA